MIPWPQVAVLAFFATSMAVITAVAVRWTAFARSYSRAGLVLFLLLMMAGMFVGVLVYYARGGLSGEIAGLWTATAIMSASVFVLFVGFFRDYRVADRPEGSPGPGPARGHLVATVIVLVLANEFLMGWSFSLLAGTFPSGLGGILSDPGGVVTSAILSPWFVFPMALEMALAVRWLRSEFSGLVAELLLVQPLIMLCSPPTLPLFLWQVVTTVAASLSMALALGLLFRSIFRGEALSRVGLLYATGLIASLGAMAGGLYLWAEDGNQWLLAAAVLAQMIVFLAAVAEPARFGGSPKEVTAPSGVDPSLDARAAGVAPGSTGPVR